MPNYRCIVLVEDIDAIGLPSCDLDSTSGGISEKNKDCRGSSRPRGQISLAGLLNAIDGLVATEAASLSRPGKLDKALTRPGWIDMVVPFTRATIESVADMLKRLYDDCSEPATEDRAQAFGIICGNERICPAARLNFITQRKDSPKKAIKDVPA